MQLVLYRKMAGHSVAKTKPFHRSDLNLMDLTAALKSRDADMPSLGRLGALFLDWCSVPRRCAS